LKWLGSLKKSLRNGLAKIGKWLSPPQRRTSQPRLRYERVDEFPDLLNPSTIYVAGEEPHMWAAAMLCPCGCGDVIELNLLEQASPCWSVRQHRDGSVTLTPSVWRRKGCRSHFFVRNNRIDWCALDLGAATSPPPPFAR
jgi:hypothetical protein